METIYTAREVAEILKISYHSTLELIKEKKLKTLKTNGVIRISESNLKEFFRGE